MPRALSHSRPVPSVMFTEVQALCYCLLQLLDHRIWQRLVKLDVEITGLHHAATQNNRGSKLPLDPALGYRPGVRYHGGA